MTAQLTGLVLPLKNDFVKRQLMTSSPMNLGSEGNIQPLKDASCLMHQGPREDRCGVPSDAFMRHADNTIRAGHGSILEPCPAY